MTDREALEAIRKVLQDWMLGDPPRPNSDAAITEIFRIFARYDHSAARRVSEAVDEAISDGAALSYGQRAAG